MKARELRIGNIIHDPHKGADGYTYVTSRTIHALDSHPCDFRPIPLTEEWLVKLGFVVHKGGSFDRAVIGDRYVFFIWRPNNTFQLLFTYQGMQINPETPIKHVHQLQNLYFALTGTELTVSEKESGQE